jgi:hypothetical protein
MAGYIEDRWLKKRPNKETGKRERTELWGKRTRYRVKGIPDVQDRSFDTVADAKAWLAEAQTDSRRGEFVDARDGEITLHEYVEKHWWPSQVHPAQTLESMRYRIWGQVLPYLGETQLRDIGAAELRKWSADVQRVVGAGTAHVSWIYVKAIMQAAVEDKRLFRIHARATAPSNRPRGPSGRRAPGGRTAWTLCVRNFRSATRSWSISVSGADSARVRRSRSARMTCAVTLCTSSGRFCGTGRSFTSAHRREGKSATCP